MRLICICLMLIGLAYCRSASKDSDVKDIATHDARVEYVAQFQQKLEQCIHKKFAPEPLNSNETQALDAIWRDIQDSPCAGCHLATSPFSDPARLVVRVDASEYDYLVGLAFRHYFTHEIIKICIAPAKVQQKLLATLNRTHKVFPNPKGMNKTALSAIADSYLSGAFDEPVSDAPRESIIKWLQLGGRLDIRHHVDLMMGELNLLYFYSNDPATWKEPAIIDLQ